jgi:hypothetical protein
MAALPIAAQDCLRESDGYDFRIIAVNAYHLAACLLEAREGGEWEWLERKIRAERLRQGIDPETGEPSENPS